MVACSEDPNDIARSDSDFILGNGINPKDTTSLTQENYTFGDPPQTIYFRLSTQVLIGTSPLQMILKFGDSTRTINFAGSSSGNNITTGSFQVYVSGFYNASIYWVDNNNLLLGTKNFVVQ